MHLSDPVTYIAGIGPSNALKLNNLGITIIKDLLLHKPLRYIDYSVVSNISNIQEGEIVTIKGKVAKITNSHTRGRRLTIQKAVITDDSGEITLTFFNQPFLVDAFKDKMVGISGPVKRFNGKLTFDNPEYEVLRSIKGIHTGRIIAVYPLTYGVSSKWLRAKIALVLKRIGEIPDELPNNVRQAHNLISFDKAVRSLHHPDNMNNIEEARKRLAFDELFHIQLAALIRKRSWQENKRGERLTVDKYKKHLDTFISNLPFTLTSDQKQTVEEVLADLTKDVSMNRLISGDVGSGKTVVAAIALFVSYLNNTKSLLMAPTEILAKQHYKTISTLLRPFNVNVGLKTSSDNNSLDPFDVVIGTHALLYEKNLPGNTSLIVIDEQHRFGVEQRSELSLRLKNPHLLTMTATPIPRTIALTFYGDLDVSTIKEMPKGRKIVKTFVVEKHKHQKGYLWIGQKIEESKKNKAHEQAFIVYPLIEESEKLEEVKAATVEFTRLKNGPFKKLQVGLLHGKMKTKEKDKIVKDFRSKKIDVLVATTVVEVGVDIPNASIMVVEHAERFGLAQLHQLRGRVGRNDQEAWCFLFCDLKTKRLDSMEHTHSGFLLSEIDLKLRGIGEVYGLRQHGQSELKFARFNDEKVLKNARTAAETIMAYDPALKKYPMIKDSLASVLNYNVLPN